MFAKKSENRALEVAGDIGMGLLLVAGLCGSAYLSVKADQAKENSITGGDRKVKAALDAWREDRKDSNGNMPWPGQFDVMNIKMVAKSL